MDRLEKWATVRHFRLVIALDEHGTILHAAHSLNLAQPTASKLLQDLEGSVGAQLFLRTRRGVTPTELGRAFVERSRMVLAQLDQVSDAIDALGQGHTGRVVVGSLLTGSSYFLPRAIANALAIEPSIRIRIVEGVNAEIMPRLFSGEIDFMIGRLTDIRANAPVTQEALYSEEAYLVCRVGHPMIEHGSLTLKALAAASWLLPPPGTTMRTQFDNIFRNAGLPPPHASVESTSFLNTLWLLKNTDLLGIQIRSVMEDPAHAQALTRLPGMKPLVLARIGISRLQHVALSPPAAILAKELRKLIEQA